MGKLLFYYWEELERDILLVINMRQQTEYSPLLDTSGIGKG